VNGRQLLLPRAKLWPGTWKSVAAEMLLIDVAAAGIPYLGIGPVRILFGRRSDKVGAHPEKTWLGLQHAGNL
jgi:hypothetical protein